MIQNVREGQPLTANIDPAEVGKAAAVGAVAGAIGGATFGLGTAALGTGFGATVASGAASGITAGQAGRATANVVEGRNVTARLGDPHDMAVDASIGAISAGAGYVVEDAAISGIAKLSTHNSEASSVMLGGYPNYRNIGEKGFTYFEMSERTWNITSRLGVSEKINVRFMEQQAAQGKTFLVTLSERNNQFGYGRWTNMELLWLEENGDYVRRGGGYVWEKIK